jgi:hypothetical protein
VNAVRRKPENHNKIRNSPKHLPDFSMHISE